MKKRGVTLIELIAAMGILIIISGVIYTMLVSGDKIYKTGNNEINNQTSARSVLMTISEGIRTARIVNSGTYPTLLTIVPYDDTDGSKVYSFVVKNSTELHKVFSSDGSDMFIAGNISSINITNSNGIYKITITIMYTEDNQVKYKTYNTSVSVRG